MSPQPVTVPQKAPQLPSALPTEASVAVFPASWDVDVTFALPGTEDQNVGVSHEWFVHLKKLQILSLNSNSLQLRSDWFTDYHMQ